MLVEELSQYSPEFKALNMVTLSRWETLTSNPSLLKKKMLLHFLAEKRCFENPLCYEIIKERYENLYEPLSKVFNKNYQYLIGNLPEYRTGKHTFYALKDFKRSKEHIEHIIDFEVATNARGYYDVTADKMETWCKYPASFCIICERKKQHMGHFVMLKIKNSVVEEIAHNKRSKFSLNKEDFCAEHENGTYYIHALYGKNSKIAAELNVEAYLHLLKNMYTTDNVMIFNIRTDGVLLTKDYGIEVIASGEDETYNVKWYGMLSPVEDILFSDTVLKLIF